MERVQPIRRLGDDLFDALSGKIARHELAEGERLPPETALAEQFGVSRPTVREVLARLRDEGLIASRRGSGSYVQHRPPAPSVQVKPAFRPVDSFDQIRQCFEFRIAVECEAAQLAAEARTQANLVDLRSALKALDQLISERRLGADADFAFHLGVARASGNSWFVSALEAMREQIQVSIEIGRRLSLHKSEEHRQRVQAEHIAVVDAIAKRDGAGARDAMRAHLDRTCDRIFRGQGK